MLISETHLKAKLQLNIPGYFVYRQDEVSPQGEAYRGLAVLVKRTLVHQAVEPKRLDTLYALGVDIQVGGGEMRLDAAYRAPSRPLRVQEVRDLLLTAPPTTPTIIAGDLNAKHQAYDTNYEEVDAAAVELARALQAALRASESTRPRSERQDPLSHQIRKMLEEKREAKTSGREPDTPQPKPGTIKPPTRSRLHCGNTGATRGRTSCSSSRTSNLPSTSSAKKLSAEPTPTGPLFGHDGLLRCQAQDRAEIHRAQPRKAVHAP
ncbi:unnamed protein product [Arctia plantaginis]|uniref:Endonuclease/exonuclease/phosphatase domain-containing protein n=1 Tax=Arctia plantaginis TaxID=874455 RepID=A0A8S0Z5H7_ARCPL|nr:unnamed protein product [Arctia plantaginis]